MYEMCPSMLLCISSQNRYLNWKEQRENNNAEHVDISSLVYRILNRYDMEGMK